MIRWKCCFEAFETLKALRTFKNNVSKTLLKHILLSTCASSVGNTRRSVARAESWSSRGRTERTVTPWSVWVTRTTRTVTAVRCVCVCDCSNTSPTSMQFVYLMFSIVGVSGVQYASVSGAQWERLPPAGRADPVQTVSRVADPERAALNPRTNVMMLMTRRLY